MYRKSFLSAIFILVLIGSFASITFSSLLQIKSAEAQVSNSGIGDSTQGTAGQASSPSSLSYLFDPSNIKVVSSYDTGYEAISPMGNELVWHISMNSVPNVRYSPTQQDMARISATGDPLYNVNVEHTITSDTISIKASFFVPYTAFSSTVGVSSSSDTSHSYFPLRSVIKEIKPQLLSQSTLASQVVPVAEASQSGESQSQSGTSSNEGPVTTGNKVRETLEGVIGVFHEYAEAVNSPIGKGFFERYEKYYEKWLSPLLDLGMYGKEILDVRKEIKEAKACLENSLIKLSPEEEKRMQDAVHSEEIELAVDLWAKGIVTFLSKIIGSGSKSAEIIVSWYADKVFKEIIDHELAYIKKLYSGSCVKPVSTQEKENLQNCILLKEKTLKTFAINSCLNQAGKAPPLQKFTK
jgi:hypothetical protein